MSDSRMNDDLRIVLLGRTGVGKSASGNTILGSEAFLSQTSPTYVTASCQHQRAQISGRDVHVIDTPGLDTQYSLVQKYMSKSRAHAILVVIKLCRFTPEERSTLKMLQNILSEESYKYTMVLFTHGENLKMSLHQFLQDNEDLKKFTDRCLGGCHVFKNTERENCSQVPELLQKINMMSEENRGGYCTTIFKEEELKHKNTKHCAIAFLLIGLLVGALKGFERRGELKDACIGAIIGGFVAAGIAAGIRVLGLKK